MINVEVLHYLTGSNNSSNYFGSVDSSQNSQKVKGHSSCSDGRPMEMEQSDHFIRYILQDQMWLLMANTNDKVMMTNQEDAGVAGKE